MCCSWQTSCSSLPFRASLGCTSLKNFTWNDRSKNEVQM
jgi:hypothetical protein